jgi:NAD(P)-dependent dehydrogenase (short-subunit alcohol dehydrogenase family)
MVSNGLGSLTLNGDLDWQFAGIKRLGYNGSKAMLNMLTVQFAWELRDTSIKVNSVNPGFTATDRSVPWMFPVPVSYMLKSSPSTNKL